jgi:hypothetical protein
MIRLPILLIMLPLAAQLAAASLPSTLIVGP